MKRIVLVNKYLPHYRLAVFNQLSLKTDRLYEIIGDTVGREGIKTIPVEYSTVPIEEGGINWTKSKSYYYKKSLQLWQTGVVSKIFSRDTDAFILDGAVSHFPTWIFALLCRLAGKKVIFWSHGIKGVDHGYKKKVREVFFKFLPHAIIIYGEFSRKIMVENGFDSAKIFVIGNSMNYFKQKKIKEELIANGQNTKELRGNLFQNNYKTLIFIGRLIPSKKVDKILFAIEELRTRDLNLNLIIIGKGPEEDNLNRLVESYNLHSLVFFANELFDEKEIAKLFLISDLLVSPGNVGLNCIHSLMYGVPVITHNDFKNQGPEVEAIYPDRNGLLFEHGNYEDMVDKIKMWFSKERPNLLAECNLPIETKFNPIRHSENIDYAVKQVLL